MTAVVKNPGSLEEPTAGFPTEGAGKPSFLLRIRLRRRGGDRSAGGLFHHHGKICRLRPSYGPRANRERQDGERQKKPNKAGPIVARSMVIIEASIGGVLVSVILAWHVNIRLARHAGVSDFRV
jgi:hypothetical protein